MTLDTYMFGKPWSYLLGYSKCKSHGKNGCSIKEENPQMKFWIFLGILELHQHIGKSMSVYRHNIYQNEFKFGHVKGGKGSVECPIKKWPHLR